MIGYLLTQNPGHGFGANVDKPLVIAVCNRMTLRKHVQFSLRLLGRQRTRGLYTIKKVWIDL